MSYILGIMGVAAWLLAGVVIVASRAIVEVGRYQNE